MAEIFAVGSLVGLEGELESPPAKLRVLEATPEGPVPCAQIRIDGTTDELWIECPEEDSLGRDRATEALRIAFRVVQKRWSAATIVILSRIEASVFAPDDFVEREESVLIRPAGVLALSAAKAARSHEAYDSVLDVHWNYVPTEVSAYEPLLSEGLYKVLDLGSGVGKNARVLMRAGHDVHAVDASAWAVSRSREFVPGLKALVSSATTLPFDDGFFDVVLDIGCLHCMPPEERPVAVQEIGRVLRSGGRLYSRIFRPRPSDWVDRQPFEAERFGLSEQEVRGLLDPVFPDLRWWRDDPDAHYLTGTRDGAPV